MARKEEVLEEQIVELLKNETDGLEVGEILGRLNNGEQKYSERSIRNLLNRLEKSSRLVKERKWSKTSPGAPPYVFFHPENVTRQLDLFTTDIGVKSYRLQTRAEVERETLDQYERARQEKAESVLEKIARGFLNEEIYARAIIDVAPRLAPERPVDLIIRMAEWIVEDLNTLADEIKQKERRGSLDEARSLAGELDIRLIWARHHFQRLWRFSGSLGNNIPGILELPRQARHMIQNGERISFDKNVAEKVLEKRIFGDKIIDICELTDADKQSSAVGSDASIADIYLEHTRGSFIPPDPVIITATAGALLKRHDEGVFEYQDFDIFPDQLRDYADHTAAMQGLVISPLLRQIMPEEEFRHSRMAAMELRQYWEDLRISLREAKWRPIGESPSLGQMPKPSLILRDGRMFPLVHRLKDFESEGFYGQLVRNEIEKFAQVVHQTLSGPGSDIVYGAVVKNPELSWLAPIVFWYLHVNKIKVNGEIVVGSHDIYRAPFADTAVSHLLFLGLAKQINQWNSNMVFVTCRVVRRYSDIATGEETLVISGQNGERVISEDNLEDWELYIQQRINEQRNKFRKYYLDPEDYRPFIYLCNQIGVSMCYSAPTVAYQALTTGDSEGHFLLPRLEIVVDLQKPQDEEKDLRKILYWMASRGCEMDRAHTQSKFDTGREEHGFPVLIPDVIVLAHEAVTFARDKLGEEVQDQIRELIATLRKQISRGR